MNLSFQFASMAELFAMEGHGPYVWACYTITLVGIAYLAISPIVARRRFFAQQKAILKRSSS